MRCMTCPGGQSPNAFAELRGITPLRRASATAILIMSYPLNIQKSYFGSWLADVENEIAFVSVRVSRNRVPMHTVSSRRERL